MVDFECAIVLLYMSLIFHHILSTPVACCEKVVTLPMRTTVPFPHPHGTPSPG